MSDTAQTWATAGPSAWRPEMNTRMPYLKMNWSVHLSRTSALSFEERGVLDRVRCELWSVVGCRMPLEYLVRTRFRLPEGSQIEAVIRDLIGLDLLRVDESGFITDEWMAEEFKSAVERSRRASENGKKGGRPPAREAPTGADF